MQAAEYTERRVGHILVVTGASGTGKTTAVQALERRGMPGVQCFYFDSIGVPSAAVMERDYGGGEQWQTWATTEWFARLGSLPDDVRVAVLDGQTRPSVVVKLAGLVAPRALQVVLFDCANDVRDARLRGPREQAELANDRMNSWAAYLRGQADAFNLAVIDTTMVSADQVADCLEIVIRRLLEPRNPAA